MRFIILRLFKNHVEQPSIVAMIPAGQTSIDKWPFVLATEVNNKSSLVHMGQLDQTGQVVPQQSAMLNKIYINDTNVADYQYLIEYILPEDEIDYIYPDYMSQYTAGTIVLGFDKKRYQCKPWPASGWCSQSPLYYEPGRGLAWQQAWTLL